MSCVSPNENVRCMCGEFEEPAHPDLGQCFPKRLKIDCVPPSIPANPCGDEEVSVIYDPNRSPPFTIVATTYDTSCLEILDTTNTPVTGPLT